MANTNASRVKPAAVTKKKWPWVVGLLILFGVLMMGAMMVLIGIFAQFSQSTSSYDSGSVGDSLGNSLGIGSSSFQLGAPTATSTEKSDFGTASGEIISVTDDSGTTTTTLEQKILKTATLSVVVNSTNEAVKGITQLAEAKGGFVISSQTYTAADDTQVGSITIRVPADQFTATVESIKDSVEVVQSESITGTDVTEEYIDLQARLKTAQALEAEYLKILEQASSVEDTLKVTKALAGVREDIEILQGQINFINARSDFSTITVSLSERPSVIPSVSDKFDLLLIFQQAFQALILIGRAALVTLIWVVVIGGPIFVVLWLVWKLARWSRHHGKPHSKS